MVFHGGPTRDLLSLLWLDAAEVPPPRAEAAPRKNPKSYQPPLFGKAYMRTLLSNRCHINAKKIVKPCQYPLKNPGGLSASGSGCVAHDTSTAMLATVTTMRNSLRSFRRTCIFSVVYRDRYFYAQLFDPGHMHHVNPELTRRNTRI